MNRAYCECPRCRRQITVSWDWDTLRTAYMDDDDGEVITDIDCIYASRVTYMHHVECPHCGTRLRVEHELVPRFYASKEGCDEQ